LRIRTSAAANIVTAFALAAPLEGAERPEGTAVPSASAPVLDGEGVRDRSLIVKYSRIFDLLD
jgi:hypothetical protein